MKTQSFLQQPVSSIVPLLNTARVLRLFVLALAMVFLLPSLAVAQPDEDQGSVQKVDPGKDPNKTGFPVNFPDWTNKPAHLFKRPDGTYYIKSNDGKVKYNIDGATVKTNTGSYQIAQMNDKRVDNFHDDVDSFIAKSIALLAANSPTSGASFFALNLPTALAMEGDNSGMWEDTFTKTYGVVGFEMDSNKLSFLGSSTSDGSTPVVYSFDTSTEAWSLNAHGETQFTFADGGTLFSGENFTEGWVLGTTPEPSSLFLLGSGILGLSGFLRKRLLT